jgi:ribosome-binding factor A
VDVSSDLRVAVVSVNLPAASEVESTMKVLAGASRMLRRELGKRVRMKYLPTLRFVHDPTLDRVDRIEQLLRDAAAGKD